MKKNILLFSSYGKGKGTDAVAIYEAVALHPVVALVIALVDSIFYYYHNAYVQFYISMKSFDPPIVPTLPLRTTVC
jgi:hypothetical protein